MKGNAINSIEIAAFLEAAMGKEASALRLKVRKLRGGLDSTGVWHLSGRCAGEPQPKRTLCLIVKAVSGTQAREAAIYREVLSSAVPGLAPTLLGVQEKDGQARLYLEAIRPAVRWPWRRSEFSGAVLTSLARLHSAPSTWPDKWLTDWDYESELAGRALQTVEMLESLSRQAGLEKAKRNLPALRRLAQALPRLREQLFGMAPFGRAFIHGDVHPGNVMVKKQSGGHVPVFLDWGRSRMGSPLEDVSSWLQSLGYWEPEAKRRHDTLLATYLEARGEDPKISRELRDAYWLAAASNLLAGAILYHLSVASDTGAISHDRRQGALQALRDCLRVIRRADACWTSSNSFRRKFAPRRCRMGPDALF